MPRSLKDVRRDASSLSKNQQLELAAFLLDNAEPSLEPPEEIEAAWEAEIQDRIVEIESGKIKGVSLAEFKNKYDRKYSK